jgi:hypothetical protein
MRDGIDRTGDPRRPCRARPARPGRVRSRISDRPRRKRRHLRPQPRTGSNRKVVGTSPPTLTSSHRTRTRSGATSTIRRLQRNARANLRRKLGNALAARFDLVWLEFAQQQYDSLSAGARAQLDAAIDRILENPDADTASAMTASSRNISYPVAPSQGPALHECRAAHHDERRPSSQTAAWNRMHANTSRITSIKSLQ